MNAPVTGTDTVLWLQSSAPAAPGLSELLEGFGHSFFIQVEEQSSRLEALLFLSNRLEAERVARQLTPLLVEWSALLPVPVTLGGIREMPREDWAERWKQYFHARKISARIVIRPPWEKWEHPEPADIVVQIDPGMCFGTGLHGTTRGCLKLMDSLERDGPRPPGAFFDLGCGSGILSITASLLGWEPVWAMDYETAAVEGTRVNAKANGVGDQLTVVQGDLAHFQPPRDAADLVVANILAPVLLAHAAKIAEVVASHAYLILSGMLHEQADAVLAAYAPLGFIEKSRLALDEWTSILLKKTE